MNKRQKIKKLKQEVAFLKGETIIKQPIIKTDHRNIKYCMASYFLDIKHLERSEAYLGLSKMAMVRDMSMQIIDDVEFTQKQTTDGRSVELIAKIGIVSKS